MADSRDPSNMPHIEVEDPQRVMTGHQPQTEPILIDDDESEFQYDPDIDEDYRRYLIQYFARNSGRTDQFIEPDDDEDDEDYVGDDFDEEDEEVEEEEEDSYSEEEEEEEDDGEDEDDDEEEDIDLMVTSPRVSVNSVEVVGEANGCGGEGKVEVAAKGGEVDGLICPICMGPWTSGGDHQVCCLSCGHLYGLSCIKRWLEHRKGSAKCPQCNKKCKPKDVRVLYASRVVVADEESKEKIKFLEGKCALLEKKNETLIKKNEDMLELIDEQSKLLSRQTERVNHLMTTQQSEINSLQAAQTESARSMDRLQAEHTESERRFQQFETQQSESLQRIRHWMSVAGIDISRPHPPPPSCIEENFALRRIIQDLHWRLACIARLRRAVAELSGKRRISSDGANGSKSCDASSAQDLDLFEGGGQILDFLDLLG